jgi:putative FmdB family regulatory protein
MPIYEYQCPKCGRQTEVLQQSQKAAPPKCQECKGEMNKIISPTAFILKGEGWYVTDYPSESRKKGMEVEKKAKDRKKKKGTASSKKKTPAPSSGGKKKKTPPRQGT